MNFCDVDETKMRRATGLLLSTVVDDPLAGFLCAGRASAAVQYWLSAGSPPDRGPRRLGHNSIKPFILICLSTACPDGEIGRRSGLKIRRPQGRGGSSPPPGTKPDAAQQEYDCGRTDVRTKRTKCPRTWVLAGVKVCALKPAKFSGALENAEVKQLSSQGRLRVIAKDLFPTCNPKSTLLLKNR
jgi:hypothetical protein